MAKTRARPGPRRRPKRRNATETVEVILEATRLLIARDGVARATTNAIARRAGVSVGSIYQYFSNKEAIVRELALRQWRLALVRVQQADERGGTLEERARGFVDAIAAAGQGDPQFRRQVLLEVPRSWVHETTAKAHTTIRALIARQIVTLQEMAGHEAPPPELAELEAFVLVHAVQGVVDAALVERPELLETDELREALSSLVTRYLRG